MIRPNKAISITVLTLGFIFLYVPILSLVIFSFNESKLVTVWSGFSTRWYAALLDDTELLQAAWLSLKIGLLTATASIVIGTWAGFVMARFGRFKGFTLFTGMINAPLVIPELLGGADTLMIGRVMWDEFFNDVDWPMASAVTVAMVLLLLVPMAVFQYYQVREMEGKS